MKWKIVIISLLIIGILSTAINLDNTDNGVANGSSDRSKFLSSGEHCSNVPIYGKAKTEGFSGLVNYMFGYDIFDTKPPDVADLAKMVMCNSTDLKSLGMLIVYLTAQFVKLVIEELINWIAIRSMLILKLVVQIIILLLEVLVLSLIKICQLVQYITYSLAAVKVQFILLICVATLLLYYIFVSCRRCHRERSEESDQEDHPQAHSNDNGSNKDQDRPENKDQESNKETKQQDDNKAGPSQVNDAKYEDETKPKEKKKTIGKCHRAFLRHKIGGRQLLTGSQLYQIEALQYTYRHEVMTPGMQRKWWLYEGTPQRSCLVKRNAAGARISAPKRRRLQRKKLRFAILEESSESDD